MPCYKPLRAFCAASGDVVFVERGDIVASLFLPCGQCVGCRLERSRQWAVRCMHEASLYDDNCFITLTYSPEHLPEDCSLHYRDFQLFLKRLRKAWPNDRIRFYMCGEYGEENHRPHFHACLFGFNFPDRVPFRQLGGSKLWRSDQLEKLWGKGHCSIGEVTFESAAYVARYVMKKVTGDLQELHYRQTDEDGVITGHRTPEFNHMSLKPGIGAKWLDKFSSDVYPDGQVVVRGHKSNPPKYYDRRFAKADPLSYEQLQYMRHLEALTRSSDQTPERLAVREQVASARIRALKRTI